jgi:hypothetical protein
VKEDLTVGIRCPSMRQVDRPTSAGIKSADLGTRSVISDTAHNIGHGIKPVE